MVDGLGNPIDGKGSLDKSVKKTRVEVKAELISSKELSGEQVNKIKDELSQNFNAKIKLDYKYDKSLIGGLVIQVGSIMVDTSIKNKLQQIENTMIEA